MAQYDAYIGKQIGNYRITRKLASGGFGSVYLAQHVILTERIVVIKLLHAVHLGSDHERNSFLREAQFLEKLKHPYILPILDVGIDSNAPYLIAEYAANGSLRDRIEQQAGRPLPLAEAQRIISQIGQALQHAHEQNIIHRDLKPENILFNAKGDALLADFGIATALSTASIKFTQVVGTPAYMAPEQFKGLISKETDQYALACIAYELYAGRRPFAAPDTMAMMYKHLNEMPASPRRFNAQLPKNVELVILKGLAKERMDRYPSVEAFVATLRTDTARQARAVTPTSLTPRQAASPTPVVLQSLPPVRRQAQVTPAMPRRRQQQATPQWSSQPYITPPPSQAYRYRQAPVTENRARAAYPGQRQQQAYLPPLQQPFGNALPERITIGKRLLAAFMYLAPPVVEYIGLNIASQSYYSYYGHGLALIAAPLIAYTIFTMIVRMSLGVTGRGNRFTRFHAMQAMLFFNWLNFWGIVVAGLYVAYHSRLPYLYGYYLQRYSNTIYLAFSLLACLFVGTWLIGLLGALSGTFPTLPFVGRRAMRFANKR